jgi:N-acetylglucosamine malate deacetylase 1
MHNVLVVATHPDDEVLGCGGVIARHVAQGHKVSVAVVSRGIPEIFPPALIAEIRQELRQAHQVLGISDVYFLDFPAPRLDVVPGHELADALAKLIRSLKAETVYLPHHGDIHGDHRAVYLATLVAARPINHCSVRKLLCYETLSETEWAPPTGNDAFVPTVFIDISLYLEKKLEAMACYRTQLQEPPYPRSLNVIRALAHFRGSTIGVPAAESFMLVREIVE